METASTEHRAGRPTAADLAAIRRGVALHRRPVDRRGIPFGEARHEAAETAARRVLAVAKVAAAKAAARQG
jgi:hypothetical protein